jgi:hypothetical protein
MEIDTFAHVGAAETIAGLSPTLARFIRSEAAMPSPFMSETRAICEAITGD